MDYHERHIEPRVARLAQKSAVLIVSGARQAGKSTLLGHLFGDRARTFVFDPVTDVAGARQDPELFLRLHPPPLILDEVQYAPELLPAIKRLVDAHPRAKGQYLLTGSQQFQVLAKAQESLAGRALLLDLFPMSSAELRRARTGGLAAALFAGAPPRSAAVLLERLARSSHEQPLPGLYERIFRGGYPGLIELGDDDLPVWFGSYLRTYVERDVRLLRDVAEPHDFSRFFRLMAALSAQEVNASQLGREIGITPKTARAWLSTLVGSYQLVILDAYAGSTVKRVSGRPKAHVVDSGFACHLLHVSSPAALADHPAQGALFESHVVMEILKQAQGLDAQPQAWHWRSSAGAEVDLLLERDGFFSPIEVKLAARPSRRDASGLAAFAATYPKLRIGPRIVVHGGGEGYLIDEHTVAVPVDWL